MSSVDERRKITWKILKKRNVFRNCCSRANILVAISKFVGYAISGSAAMLNESIHSIVDCSNQILLLFGDKQANKGQSELHQFGEGRAKYFSVQSSQ